MPPQLLSPTADILSRSQVRLRTITPVHIMGRRQIGKNRFLITNKRRVVVDEQKLFEQLARHNAVDLYFDSVCDGRSALYPFFKTQNWLGFRHGDQCAEQIAAYHLSWYQNNDPQESPGDIARIHPFVRDHHHHPYIPGTSLKGAIRTAVLYEHLARWHSDDNRFGKIITLLKSGLGQNDARLVEQGLQSFVVNDLAGEPLPIKDVQQRDFLKNLLVSDSQPMTGNLCLGRVQWLSKGGFGGWHFSPSDKSKPIIKVFAEVIPENVCLNGEMAVDNFSRRCFGPSPWGNGFQDLDQLLQQLRQFADALLDFEEQFLRDIYNHGKDRQIHDALEYQERIRARQPNLRLGWGCSKSGLTLLRLLLLRPDLSTAKELNDIRYQYFPKTRRHLVTQSNADWNLATPLGWCKLEMR